MTEHPRGVVPPGPVSAPSLPAELAAVVAAAVELRALDQPERFSLSALRRRALVASRRYVQPIETTWDRVAGAYVDVDPAGTRQRILADFRRRYPYVLRDAIRYVAAAVRGRRERAQEALRERLIRDEIEPAPPVIEKLRAELFVIDCRDHWTGADQERRAQIHHEIDLDAWRRRVAAIKRLGLS